MQKITRYKDATRKRVIRTRANIWVDNSLPRLTVIKSNKYIYAQIINLATGKTLTGVKGTKASQVGEKVAKEATKKKVSRVVFDRGGYQYHGKVKALAEAARKGGLEF